MNDINNSNNPIIGVFFFFVILIFTMLSWFTPFFVDMTYVLIGSCIVLALVLTDY